MLIPCYAIYSPHNNAWWNEGLERWDTEDVRTLFTSHERSILPLPNSGHWVGPVVED